MSRSDAMFACCVHGAAVATRAAILLRVCLSFCLLANWAPQDAGRPTELRPVFAAVQAVVGA